MRNGMGRTTQVDLDSSRIPVMRNGMGRTTKVEALGTHMIRTAPTSGSAVEMIVAGIVEATARTIEDVSERDYD